MSGRVSPGQRAYTKWMHYTWDRNAGVASDQPAWQDLSPRDQANWEMIADPGYGHEGAPKPQRCTEEMTMAEQRWVVGITEQIDWNGPEERYEEHQTAEQISATLARRAWVPATVEYHIFPCHCAVCTPLVPDVPDRCECGGILDPSSMYRLTNFVQPSMAMVKARNLVYLLLYAHDHSHTGRKKRVPLVDIDNLVTLWVDVLVDLTTAHDHGTRSVADERSDDLLTPLLAAPIKQIRLFAAALAKRLREDERVPFLVWSMYEKVLAPIITHGSDSEMLALKDRLATEIAEMVAKQLPQSEIVMSIAAALQWRDPGTLEKVKSGLKAGAKPRLRGGESCLFLSLVDTSDKELARVVL